MSHPGAWPVTQHKSRRGAFSAAVLAVLSLATGALTELRGQSGDTLEVEVKAAMIYNFTRFVEWPAESFTDPKAPFVVAIAGDDALGRAVEGVLKDKLVAGRAVQFKHVQWLGAGEPAQLLIVLRSERKRASELVRSASRAGLLTIGDMDSFTASGGAIGIVVEDKRARFDVNLEAAAKGRLTISSKLLRLARNVLEHSGKG